MLQWIKHQYTHSSAYSMQELRPRLLSLDVFTAQKTPAVLNAFKALNCIPSMILGGCTGYVQVLDVAVNKPLKDHITELAENVKKGGRDCFISN